MRQLLFTDSVVWNGTNKTAVSVRDGVIEYLGSELGVEPANSVFTVYRSPATIAKASLLMVGIPLIKGHIDPETDPAPDTIGGTITSSEVVDHFSTDTSTNLAIKNVIEVNKVFSDNLTKGMELSLGYKGMLIEHSTYDYEQRDIVPKHLAIVEAGRCGSACSFIDGKEVLMMKGKKALNKVFTDENGTPNMEQIVEIAQALPDALKELSIDKLKALLPTLQGIVADSGLTPVIDEEASKPEEEAPKSEEVSKPKEEAPKPDSTAFEDAMSKVLARHTEVLEKASKFVDGSLAGKSTVEVMRAAVKAVHGETVFTDSELPVAFKMLKEKTTSYSNFGDANLQKPKTLSERIEESLGE